ncbi:MAG: bifunctional enoyl-CoA hydratase/phosphate acetyltransferase [Gammaproteobacteria bacterium]|jgi:phosphotransacetylase|nr:bifunctional enoyl-CoA hydratase/phosphate acetyltransferase [Gammaproteobacteria bacterium]
MLSNQLPICPAALLNQAQATPPKATAVINAGTELAMESARQAEQAGIIKPILVGNVDKIRSLAAAMAWQLNDDQVVAADGEQAAAATAVALVHQQRAQMLMKGHIHSDTLLRAVLDKQHGLRTGARLSHVFYMTVAGSDQALCITDAVINVAPDLTTQHHILHNCIKLMHALGFAKPNIALLSAAEVPTPAMPSSMLAKELLDKVSGENIAAQIFGPVAFDGAISPEAAKVKGIQAPGAGAADVLLVPNIETGNAIFKQLVYFSGATAAGLILGAKVPIILTSRADPPAARLASAALGVIYAHWLDQQV